MEEGLQKTLSCENAVVKKLLLYRGSGGQRTPTSVADHWFPYTFVIKIGLLSLLSLWALSSVLGQPGVLVSS